MKYIFNNCIEYNSDTGEMFLLGSDVNIEKFTPILNRILKVLVENNTMIIPREEFLSRVWNDHGLNASSNTLNQYISTLRKLFAQHLNIENAILNIPKKGIILSSEIVIITSESESYQESNLVENNPSLEITNKNRKPNLVELKTNKDLCSQDENDNSVFYVKKDKLTKKYNYLKIMLVSIFLLLLFSVNNLFFKKNHVSKIKYYHITTIGSCPVYSFKNDFDENYDLVNINEHLSEFNLSCNPDTVFYYYNNYNTARTKKQSMLTMCEKGKSCISTRINR